MSLIRACAVAVAALTVEVVASRSGNKTNVPRSGRVQPRMMSQGRVGNAAVRTVRRGEGSSQERCCQTIGAALALLARSGPWPPDSWMVQRRQLNWQPVCHFTFQVRTCSGVLFDRAGPRCCRKGSEGQRDNVGTTRGRRLGCCGAVLLRCASLLNLNSLVLSFASRCAISLSYSTSALCP